MRGLCEREMALRGENSYEKKKVRRSRLEKFFLFAKKKLDTDKTF